MSIFEQQIELAWLAERERDYPKAEKILAEALDASSEPGQREQILRRLFYLYFSPVYEHLTNAEACLNEIDRLNPSAQNALAWAMFELNCRQNIREARSWAEIATERAKSEKADYTLYSALALVGLLAVRESDFPRVQNVLQELHSLARKGEQLPFGDEVLFLEACINLDADIRRGAAELAIETAPHIDNPEFRARAESLTQNL